MVYISSDHGGFELKKQIKEFLVDKGIEVVDLGPSLYDPEDDYPIYAQKLGEATVVNNAMGIGICKSGAGMAIAANKVDGVRAIEVVNHDQAITSREDDDTNVLVFGAKYFDADKDMNLIIDWLNAKFKGTTKYSRRIDEIKNYEKTN